MNQHAFTNDPIVSDGGIIRGDANLARYIGCSWRHVIDLRNKRNLPHIRVGRSVMYRVADIEAYLTSHSNGQIAEIA